MKKPAKIGFLLLFYAIFGAFSRFASHRMGPHDGKCAAEGRGCVMEDVRPWNRTFSWDKLRVELFANVGFCSAWGCLHKQWV